MGGREIDFGDIKEGRERGEKNRSRAAMRGNEDRKEEERDARGENRVGL